MFFFSFLSSFLSFLTRQSLLDFIQGSHRVLNSWKSLEICSDLEQIWKIEIKSGKKLVNSLEVFFKLQKMLYKWIFLVLVKSYSIFPVCLQRTTKKALFLHFLRSLLIIYLISVSLKEKTIVLKKKSGKSLEFWIHKFVRTMFINNRLKAT